MARPITLRDLIVEPRGLASPWIRLMVPVSSVLAALVVGAVFLTITGNSAGEVYAKMLDNSFGSARTISETLVAATPLILTGVAAAVAFKMLVWNIGGEGQLMFGAIAAAGMGIALGEGTGALIAVPLVVVAGGIGGAIWAGVAAVPRVYLGTNEIITTLMLNFIALNLMNYLIFGSFSPWRDPNSPQFPQGRPLGDSASMPSLVDGYRADYGILVAIAVAVFAWLLIGRTRWGFELRVAGDSPDAARYAGINVPRKVLGVFLLSGAAAGLAGGLLISGILGRLDPQALNSGSRLHRHHRGRPRPTQSGRSRPGGYFDRRIEQRRSCSAVDRRSHRHCANVAGRHPRVRSRRRVFDRSQDPTEAGRGMNDSLLILTVVAAIGQEHPLCSPPSAK